MVGAQTLPATQPEETPPETPASYTNEGGTFTLFVSERPNDKDGEGEA